MKMYLVGGAVRDLLLGRVPTDPDYAFTGSAEAFCTAHPHARIVGESVQVYLLHGREYMPLRGGTITSDLAARDLTVNALALADDGKLYLHPQALEDLRNRVLRPASATALRDDPARVFRLARFAAELPDFEVHQEGLAQMRAVPSAVLAAIPAERVGRELLKALAAPQPGRFFETAAAGNCLSPWFAELEKARQITAGPAPYHNGSVFAHTIDVMAATAGDPTAAWMALCHDLGKICTDPALLPHHYGHEERGTALAATLAQRLRLSTGYTKAGIIAAREHQKAGRYMTLKPGTRRDLLLRVEAAGCSRSFWRLVDADSDLALSIPAAEELALLKTVRLPEAWHDRGEDSAKKLRDLHCRELALHGIVRS